MHYIVSGVTVLLKEAKQKKKLAKLVILKWHSSKEATKKGKEWQGELKNTFWF